MVKRREIWDGVEARMPCTSEQPRVVWPPGPGGKSQVPTVTVTLARAAEEGLILRVEPDALCKVLGLANEGCCDNGR